MKKDGVTISHNKTLFWIIIVLFILLIFIIALIIRNAKNENSDNVNYCKTDSDCVKVRTSCCGCSSGGQEACVLKKDVNIYNERLANCTDKVLCAQVYNCKIESCSCVKGVCVSNEK